MDFKYPFMEVEESAGNVTLCVYICDGGLKRNASITLATEDAMATCEWYIKNIYFIRCVYSYVVQ